MEYSKYFVSFLKDFGLKGLSEYNSLSKKEKDITNKAYLRDIPYQIKKHQKLKQSKQTNHSI